MKTYILLLSVLISVFSVQLLKAQGTEGFDKFIVGSDEIKSGSFIGNNNVTWNYTNCLGDKDRLASYTNTFADKGFKSVAQQFSQKGCSVFLTNEYVAPPDSQYNVKTKEWHLKASYGPSTRNKILTVIQLMPNTATLPVITKLGEGNFQCGEWNISAELNGDLPARLYIRNNSKDATFSLGNDNPLINGSTYKRQKAGSSILYDEIGGVKKVEEMNDRPAQGTR